MKNVIIFDLDETVINSLHRTPNFPDGTLDLNSYLKNQTENNIKKDTLLPIARIMRERYAMGDYIIILTARAMLKWDYDYLAENDLPYNKIFSREQCKTSRHAKLKDGEYKLFWIKSFLNLRQFKNKPVIMFDDAKPVKSVLRKLFPVLCGHKINRKIS